MREFMKTQKVVITHPVAGRWTLAKKRKGLRTQNERINTNHGQKEVNF